MATFFEAEQTRKSGIFYLSSADDPTTEGRRGVLIGKGAVYGRGQPIAHQTLYGLGRLTEARSFYRSWPASAGLPFCNRGPAA